MRALSGGDIWILVSLIVSWICILFCQLIEVTHPTSYCTVAIFFQVN